MNKIILISIVFTSFYFIKKAVDYTYIQQQQREKDRDIISKEEQAIVIRPHIYPIMIQPMPKIQIVEIHNDYKGNERIRWEINPDIAFMDDRDKPEYIDNFQYLTAQYVFILNQQIADPELVLGDLQIDFGLGRVLPDISRVNYKQPDEEEENQIKLDDKYNDQYRILNIGYADAGRKEKIREEDQVISLQTANMLLVINDFVYYDIDKEYWMMYLVGAIQYLSPNSSYYICQLQYSNENIYNANKWHNWEGRKQDGFGILCLQKDEKVFYIVILQFDPQTTIGTMYIIHTYYNLNQWISVTYKAQSIKQESPISEQKIHDDEQMTFELQVTEDNNEKFKVVIQGITIQPGQVGLNMGCKKIHQCSSKIRLDSWICAYICDPEKNIEDIGDKGNFFIDEFEKFRHKRIQGVEIGRFINCQNYLINKNIVTQYIYYMQILGYDIGIYGKKLDKKKQIEFIQKFRLTDDEQDDNIIEKKKTIYIDFFHMPQQEINFRSLIQNSIAMTFYFKTMGEKISYNDKCIYYVMLYIKTYDFIQDFKSDKKILANMLKQLIKKQDIYFPDNLTPEQYPETEPEQFLFQYFFFCLALIIEAGKDDVFKKMDDDINTHIKTNGVDCIPNVFFGPLVEYYYIDAAKKSKKDQNQDHRKKKDQNQDPRKKKDFRKAYDLIVKIHSVDIFKIRTMDQQFRPYHLENAYITGSIVKNMQFDPINGKQIIAGREYSDNFKFYDDKLHFKYMYTDKPFQYMILNPQEQQVFKIEEETPLQSVCKSALDIKYLALQEGQNTQMYRNRKAFFPCDMISQLCCLIDKSQDENNKYLSNHNSYLKNEDFLDYQYVIYDNYFNEITITLPNEFSSLRFDKNKEYEDRKKKEEEAKRLKELESAEKKEEERKKEQEKYARIIQRNINRQHCEKFFKVKGQEVDTKELDDDYGDNSVTFMEKIKDDPDKKKRILENFVTLVQSVPDIHLVQEKMQDLDQQRLVQFEQFIKSIDVLEEEKEEEPDRFLGQEDLMRYTQGEYVSIQSSGYQQTYVDYNDIDPEDPDITLHLNTFNKQKYKKPTGVINEGGELTYDDEYIIEIIGERIYQLDYIFNNKTYSFNINIKKDEGTEIQQIKITKTNDLVHLFRYYQFHQINPYLLQFINVYFEKFDSIQDYLKFTGLTKIKPNMFQTVEQLQDDEFIQEHTILYKMSEDDDFQFKDFFKQVINYKDKCYADMGLKLMEEDPEDPEDHKKFEWYERFYSIYHMKNDSIVKFKSKTKEQKEMARDKIEEEFNIQEDLFRQGILTQNEIDEAEQQKKKKLSDMQIEDQKIDDLIKKTKKLQKKCLFEEKNMIIDLEPGAGKSSTFIPLKCLRKIRQLKKLHKTGIYMIFACTLNAVLDNLFIDLMALLGRIRDIKVCKFDFTRIKQFIDKQYQNNTPLQIYVIITSHSDMKQLVQHDFTIQGPPDMQEQHQQQALQKQEFIKDHTKLLIIDEYHLFMNVEQQKFVSIKEQTELSDYLMKFFEDDDISKSTYLDYSNQADEYIRKLAEQFKEKKKEQSSLKFKTDYNFINQDSYMSQCRTKNFMDSDLIYVYPLSNGAVLCQSQFDLISKLFLTMEAIYSLDGLRMHELKKLHGRDIYNLFYSVVQPKNDDKKIDKRVIKKMIEYSFKNIKLVQKQHITTSIDVLNYFNGHAQIVAFTGTPVYFNDLQLKDSNFNFIKYSDKEEENEYIETLAQLQERMVKLIQIVDEKYGQFQYVYFDRDFDYINRCYKRQYKPYDPYVKRMRYAGDQYQMKSLNDVEQQFQIIENPVQHQKQLLHCIHHILRGVKESKDKEGERYMFLIDLTGQMRSDNKKFYIQQLITLFDICYMEEYVEGDDQEGEEFLDRKQSQDEQQQDEQQQDEQQDYSISRQDGRKIIFQDIDGQKKMCFLSGGYEGKVVFQPYDYVFSEQNLYVYFNSDITGQDFGVKNEEFQAIQYSETNKNGLKNILSLVLVDESIEGKLLNYIQGVMRVRQKLKGVKVLFFPSENKEINYNHYAPLEDNELHHVENYISQRQIYLQQDNLNFIQKNKTLFDKRNEEIKKQMEKYRLHKQVKGFLQQFVKDQYIYQQYNEISKKIHLNHVNLEENKIHCGMKIDISNLDIYSINKYLNLQPNIKANDPLNISKLKLLEQEFLTEQYQQFVLQNYTKQDGKVTIQRQYQQEIDRQIQVHRQQLISLGRYGQKLKQKRDQFINVFDPLIYHQDIDVITIDPDSYCQNASTLTFTQLKLMPEGGGGLQKKQIKKIKMQDLCKNTFDINDYLNYGKDAQVQLDQQPVDLVALEEQKMEEEQKEEEEEEEEEKENEYPDNSSGTSNQDDAWDDLI